MFAGQIGELVERGQTLDRDVAQCQGAGCVEGPPVGFAVGSDPFSECDYVSYDGTRTGAAVDVIDGGDPSGVSRLPANAGNRYDYVRRDLRGPLSRAQPGSRTSSRASGSVDVGAVVDVDDEDGAVLFVDPEQDAVVAAAGAAEAGEIVAQRFAQPVGILRQWAGDEFDDRMHDPSRQPGQGSAGR